MVQLVSPPGYQAARHAAALLDRSDRGRLLVSGADRAAYLHGLLTNDVAALTPGSGCYAAYLTPQGRMITDVAVYELGDAILLTLEGAVKDAVLAKLDHLIFTEDVQLSDLTRTLAQIAIIGPDAGRIVASVVDGVSPGELASLREHDNRRGAFGGRPAIVTRVNDTGEPGFELYVDREDADRLIAALAAAGASSIDPDTSEALRIEAGVPRFRRDMDEETIPLEAGIESRALSFTKGCYVGQEVIVRVLHRGHGRVARKLVGLTLTGDDVPASGAIVRREGADVGHVTSSAISPALGRPIALAYVHRDSVEPGTEVEVNGTPAVVTTLPFRPLD